MTIPVAYDTHEVESTLTGRAIGMTIDQASIHHIMDRLSVDLYKDAQLAVIREYSTNARDSHIEAGCPERPIELTMPSSLAPTLRIRDYGIGLSAQDIEDIYSKYGLSTKHHTNDLNGVLGLGCKSGLAYSNQFSLVGVKDGVMTQVAITRDSQGRGVMTIVAETETDEPNGVEVVVPAKLPNEFAYKAAQLFRYWPEGSVLVDGEAPERLPDADRMEIARDVALQLAADTSDPDRLLTMDDLLPVPASIEHVDIDLYKGRVHSYNVRAVVVMGGVPYPIDIDKCDFGVEEGYTLVAYLPNGSLHFVASREELKYTDHTLATLEALRVQFKESLADAIQSEIDLTSDHPSALRVALKWKTSLGDAVEGLNYKGDEIPWKFSMPYTEVVDGQPVERLHRFIFTAYSGIRLADHEKVTEIETRSMASYHFVEGYDRPGLSAAVKKKLQMHCTNNGIYNCSYFVLAASLPATIKRWIEPSALHQWDAISQIKLPRRSNGRQVDPNRIAGSYEAYVCVDGQVSLITNMLADEIDPTVPVYWSTQESYAVHDMAKTMATYFLDEFVVVMMTSNRIAKFNRMFPNAEQFAVQPLINDAFDFWWSLLTVTERKLLTMERAVSGYSCRGFEALPVTGIRDPELREAAKLYRDEFNSSYYSSRYSQRVKRLRNQSDFFGGRVPDEWENPLKRYPLLNTHGAYYGDMEAKQHARIYINAVYDQLYANREEK